MKIALAATGSFILTSIVLANAFYVKKLYYPSIVFITKSNPSLAAIYFQYFVFLLLLSKVARRIFFGTLRAAELEHLIERSWYAVTETCLAFTVFRDDLSPNFVAFFSLLLFLKCFHWMAEDRVDYMERSTNIYALFHIRIISLLLILSFCDISFLRIAYQSGMTKGSSLIFGFEYAILVAAILNIIIKYILHWIDLRSDSPWDEKAVFLLYTELLMGIVKLSLYLLFAAAMIKFHNFPLFALRPIYLSVRSLKKAFCDVIMSRRAIRNMNELYPNATQEELANSDNVCIICREEMTGNGMSKKLPCNHIFHVSCLRSWFQRQQTCPTCRLDILRIPNTSQQQARQAHGARLANQNARNQAVPNNHAGPSNQSSNDNVQSSPSSSSQQRHTGPNGVQHVALNDAVAALMIQGFAQMFVQAILTHIQALNNDRRRNNNHSTRDASTNTDSDVNVN